MMKPLTLETNPNPADTHFLSERIYEYNVARTHITDGKLLGIFVRDDEGHIIAGLDGWTWGGCLWVEHLWVHEQWRGHNYGTELLHAAEAEAIQRGCQQAMLTTHSFQAPAFYQRHGYHIVGSCDDYPHRHQYFFLRKKLTLAKAA